MTDAQQPTLFVSSVSGRLVQRWGSNQYFGARRVGMTVQFDEAAVIPLYEPFVSQYRRELDAAIANGDLLQRTSEEFEAYAKKRDEAEAEAVKAAERAKKAAEAEAKKLANEAAEAAKKKAEAEAKKQGGGDA